MSRIITAVIMSFFCCFQVHAAEKTSTPASAQRLLPSKITKPPTTAIKPLIAKPDLVISHFSIHPKTTTNGGTLDYTLSVHNKGGTSSQGTMLVGLHVNTPQTGISVNMKVPKAGKSESIAGKIGVGPATCNAATFIAELDAHHQVDESNENNNTATDQVTINNRPELGFCKTTGSCKDMYNAGNVGKQIAVCVDVHNYGCLANNNATLAINCPDQWPITVKIPPVTPGKFWAHCQFLSWNTPGIRECKIKITPDQGQTDAYNFNENITYRVNVTPGP